MAFRFRAQRAWDATLTGIPFGIYKVGSGLLVWEHFHTPLAYFLMAWGSIDLLTNLAAAFWSRPLPYCLLSFLGRLWDRGQGFRHGHAGEQLALAVDALLSFSLQATMIWFRWLGSLPEPWRRLWELAVIAQIVSAGLLRVNNAARFRELESM